MTTAKSTKPLADRFDTNNTNEKQREGCRQQLLLKDIANTILTNVLIEYVQSVFGQDEIVKRVPVMAEKKSTSRTLLITLRYPESVEYFMNLRPHSIKGIPLLVMRSLPSTYPLHNTITEYLLITVNDNSEKLDAESVRHFASDVGMIKTLESVDNEFLIHFDDYDSVDKLIMIGRYGIIDGTKVTLEKTLQKPLEQPDISVTSVYKERHRPSIPYETIFYLTISYNRCDAALFQSRLARMAAHCKHVYNKKCVSIIQGLVSRSYQLSNEALAYMFQRLFSDIPVWIKHGLKLTEELDVYVPDEKGHLWEISFGYLISTQIYLWHKKITGSNSLKWKTNITQNYIAIECQTSLLLQLRFTLECLDKYFIVASTDPGVHMIVLPLRTSPRCYEMLSRGESIVLSRKLDFGMIDMACLANTSAICLKFADKASLRAFATIFVRVTKLDLHEGYVKCVKMYNEPDPFDHCLLDFWSSYAYQTLLSLGYRIKHHMTLQTFQKMRLDSHLSLSQQYPNHLCYSKLMAIYYQARQNRFFDINKEYDQVQPLPYSIVLDKWVYVPRVHLTPYGVFPLPVQPIQGNRILRQKDLFGPCEHFCIVNIRDIDFDVARQEFVKLNESWIKNTIIAKNFLYVGDRKFYFLFSSNSQLKNRSFWFHAPYLGRTAEDIRLWMGDFSRETCIGMRIARMGLSLTSTTQSITLTDDQMERIDDKKDDQGRAFTDGAGKISPEALRQALMLYRSHLVDDDYIPCVIQIRLNGLKGVFVKAPDLENRSILIQYRPSQYKFDASHNVLEIVKHFRSGTAFLNQQIIVLLENMGVKEQNFIRLQNQTRLEISMLLLANKTAKRVLEQHIRYYDWERMRLAGIHLTKEPFSRSLLLLHARERLRRLKEKSNVPIPQSDGRILVGVVDETDSLQHGQVFIQLRESTGESRIIHSCKVLITKNPAHFPGDVLKLDAVNCPALHHLSECIVFPTQGPRPHPNEISGGDTDGDEYWVCWNENFVQNATQQYPPALFNATEKLKHDGSITMIEIADFIFKYLSSNSLGLLSKRHLACCAINGPNDATSCHLARVISDAVDFPKTGIFPDVSNNIKINEYPDFMEVKNKPFFKSEKSLGVMYRQVKEVWEIHSMWTKMMDEGQTPVDPQFLIAGYQQYIDQAAKCYNYYSSKINAILLMYNLTDEYELITGCHSCAEDESSNSDSVKSSLLEFQCLLQEMRDRFAAEQLNYNEQKMKASAWYYVAYAAGSTLSFAWIMIHLMCNIAQDQQIVQEKHQALKRIGLSLLNGGSGEDVKNWAQFYHLTNNENEHRSEAVKLGEQFLKIIDKANQSETDQIYAHQFLKTLHKISLNQL